MFINWIKLTNLALIEFLNTIKYARETEGIVLVPRGQS